MPVLDVRPLPPAQRHPQIFSTLDALGAGEVLVLVNDHAPTPLRYQLEATRPRQFTWTEQEKGPERWTVEIASHTRIVDARPIIAAGGEPFETIMKAVADLGPTDVLVVLAPFEPVPLEGVLSSQGFAFHAEETSPGEWRTAFWSAA